MNEENSSIVTVPPEGGRKGVAAAVIARIRNMLTPELGKRAAICIFLLLLLLCECISCFIAKSNTDSIVNPFIQGMWLYLAIFGLSLIPGGRATRIILTFWIAVTGAVAAAGVFLHLRFALDMDCDTFFVLAASSNAEIGEFLGRFLSWRLIVILLTAAAACGGMIALVWRTVFVRSYLNTAIALLLALPFVVNCIRYAAEGEMKRVYSRSNLPRLVSGYFVYRNEFSKLLELEKHPRLPSGIRELAGGGELVGVLVIGESANCNHWGVYGYPRDTTPEVAKRRESCLIYRDAVAPAPFTTKALYYMLTDARLAKRRKYPDFTLIDVLKAAGWRVVLISDQTRWGRNDGPIGILTAHCDRRTYLHEKFRRPYDMDILPELEKELRGTSRGRLLIIVHLIGSHQDFSVRYPEGFARFDNVRDDCNSGMSDEHAREINEYDNSIAYTDQVLGGILSLLEKKSSPAFMLYCSDHGEVGEWSGYRHARSKASEVPEVYEVPFVLWSNPAYRKAFPEFWTRAARNLYAPLQTDRLIWSCLSASQVTFDDFPEREDIFSGERYRSAAKRVMAKTPYRFSEAKRQRLNAERK